MMRYSKIIPAMLAVAFLSCDREKEQSFVDMSAVATFEAAELSDKGYVNDKSYVEHVAEFGNVYDAASDYWHGFAVSSCTDVITSGYENQYSVYGNGGANGSEKFGVCYYDGMEPSALRFKVESVNANSVWVNNSAYAAITMRDGNQFARKFKDGDWFRLTIKGYKEEQQRGSVDFYLADFRDGKTFICNQWTKVDLSALTDVDRLDFTIDSSDRSGEWINTPTYVCIDNLAYGYRIVY